MARAPEPAVHAHRIRPPALPPRLVARPRLTARIQATGPGGTCAISAAPGYGATTALAVAVQETPDHTAWVRLGPEDADPVRLWQHVAASIAQESGRPVDPQPAAILESLDRMAPLWLVLDGVDPLVHHAALPGIADLSADLPPAARLGVTAHGSVLRGPRVVGRLHPVAESDLAFLPDEAAELLAGVDAEYVDEVCRLAEGWAAALVAAAGHARSRRDPAAWLQGQGCDLLLDDWLSCLPDDQRDFLLETAVLQVLAAGPCDALRQRDDSAAVLDGLDRDHRLVREQPAPVPALGRAWSRHPLLTLLLRRRGECGEQAAGRHSRAADWYAAAGDVTSALDHLLASGRHREAGEYLRVHEGDLLGSGRAGQALSAYSRLLGDAGPADALHLLRLGWGRALSGDITGAEAVLARLRSEGWADEAEPGDEERLLLQGEVHVLRGYLAAARADTITLLESAQRGMAAFGDRRERDSEQVAPLLLIRGLQWTGDNDRAARLLDAVLEHPSRTGVIREGQQATLQAHRLLTEGRVLEARNLADRAIGWMHGQGWDPVAIGYSGPVAMRALAELECGDPQAAATALGVVTRATAERGQHGESVVAMAGLALVRWVHGDTGGACRTLREARGVLAASAPASGLAGQLDCVEARVRIDGGDLIRAERMVRALPPSETRTMLWARLAIARGIPGSGRPLPTLPPTTPRLLAEGQLLSAVANRSTGIRLAEAHAMRAADVAARHGLGLLLIGLPADVLAFLDETARRHGHDDLRWLLDRRPVERANVRPAGPPVSRGEMQLLTLLPGRESVAEIAGSLGISANTVKTRLRRLYRKLGVSSRDQALAVARTRGLM